jgi:serine/threonine protein kinase
MWSVGCILAELFTRQTLFRGKDETNQIQEIFSAIGNKKEELSAGYQNLEIYSKTNIRSNLDGIGLKVYLEKQANFSIDPDALDLIGKMLALDPSKRISAKEALEHVY